MKNKSIIIISIVLISAMAGFGFWVLKNQEEGKEIILKKEGGNSVSIEEKYKSQDKKQKFIVDYSCTIGSLACPL